ncbi:type 2 isopentenyl-diphosphate Delta-isomerase [Lactococcus nasutitermitis]|uniref:Isopentenyl-diphosphate delta-isomerase n=1 Tax=Lactococcus nasutitermitis TaxID=1652957 RepID=A0ABV9JBT1_9LACT|nr:type 2 isopentenyl-diphosphate Delta-isomerase [Lactococcus nasutitermitis]
MTEKEIHQHRKDEHLSLAVKYWKKGLETPSGLGFQDLRLVPQALPEIALNEVDLSVPIFGGRFDFPFYIEAMTGGSAHGDKLNEQLAEIAANQHLALAVGSQSIALKFPELAAGFARVREINPTGFIFANIGAGHGLEQAKRAVDMLKANALEIHINTAQELTMKENEGDRSFYWLENIHEIAEKLDVPVIVKEVGFGISRGIFEQLKQTAVSAVNVGGKSGTDFAWIEHQRGGDFELIGHGFTTVESLLEAQFAKTQLPVIATGGIRCAEDVFKSQILGAILVSSAGFILQNLIQDGPDKVEQILENWKSDLTKFYTLFGVKNLTELSKIETLYSADMRAFIEQRNF